MACPCHGMPLPWQCQWHAPAALRVGGSKSIWTQVCKYVSNECKDLILQQRERLLLFAGPWQQATYANMTTRLCRCKTTSHWRSKRWRRAVHLSTRSCTGTGRTSRISCLCSSAYLSLCCGIRCGLLGAVILCAMLHHIAHTALETVQCFNMMRHTTRARIARSADLANSLAVRAVLRAVSMQLFTQLVPMLLARTRLVATHRCVRRSPTQALVLQRGVWPCTRLCASCAPPRSSRS